MVKIVWTDLALQDLEDIGDYIAVSSQKYAKLTLRNLFDKTAVLKTFPKIGRVVPEKNDDDIRELIEGNYRIIYEIATNEQINILTVYHSARVLKI